MSTIAILWPVKAILAKRAAMVEVRALISPNGWFSEHAPSRNRALSDKQHRIGAHCRGWGCAMRSSSWHLLARAGTRRKGLERDRYLEEEKVKQKKDTEEKDEEENEEHREDKQDEKEEQKGEQKRRKDTIVLRKAWPRSPLSLQPGKTPERMSCSREECDQKRNLLSSAPSEPSRSKAGTMTDQDRNPERLKRESATKMRKHVKTVSHHLF